MKTSSALFQILTVLATLPPVTSAAPAQPEFKPFILNLRPGSSPTTVRTLLGTPHATLGPDLWIYWNFGPNPNRDHPAFDTLVVAFTNEAVTAVKVTDGRIVRQLLVQTARVGQTHAVVASPPQR